MSTQFCVAFSENLKYLYIIWLQGPFYSIKFSQAFRSFLLYWADQHSIQIPDSRRAYRQTKNKSGTWKKINFAFRQIEVLPTAKQRKNAQNHCVLTNYFKVRIFQIFLVKLNFSRFSTAKKNVNPVWFDDFLLFLSRLKIRFRRLRFVYGWVDLEIFHMRHL